MKPKVSCGFSIRAASVGAAAGAVEVEGAGSPPQAVNSREMRTAAKILDGCFIGFILR
jgi:hypothetical protein